MIAGSKCRMGRPCLNLLEKEETGEEKPRKRILFWMRIEFLFTMSRQRKNTSDVSNLNSDTPKCVIIVGSMTKRNPGEKRKSQKPTIFLSKLVGFSNIQVNYFHFIYMKCCPLFYHFFRQFLVVLASMIHDFQPADIYVCAIRYMCI